MFQRFDRLGAAALAFLLTTSALAEAQPLAGTFSQLQVLVKPGDTVSVTDSTGSTINGRIEALSSSSLALMVAGKRLDLLEDGISTIRRRGPDSLKNGAKWGFGIGAGFGTLVGIALALDCNNCGGGGFIPVAAALYGGMGAGIGVGVDAMIEGQRVIYAKSTGSSAKVTFAPLLTRDRTGVLMSWRLSKHH